ncbi:gag-proteinase polyprotein [Cucumis melo var. makuwa]|uniref:Gag-proteinase polyprotein n=1 Tax=Cucumis melo var. makuwa TaxID=1194695 RepID=A0A5A7U4B1_CUCMM|nr:gag-proteinase polyprotein [Cucumis melo var. makuwa]
MDFVRDGTSTTRPSILDGTNYTYWKARMMAFLRSIDNKCLKATISRWKHPTIQSENGKISLKSEISWIKEEDETSLGNSRAVNALLNDVDQNVFKLIYTCSSTKGWNILKTAYEGTSKVKISRL